MPVPSPPALSLDLPGPRRPPATVARGHDPAFYFVFAFLGIFGYALSLWLPQRASFAYLTLLMIGYLTFEVTRYARSRPSHWLVNPAVLTSIFVFGLPFGVTNAIYFLPESYGAELFSDMWHGDFSWMNSAMLMALLAAFAMWRGFYSRVGRNVASSLQRSQALSGVLRRRYELNLPMVLVLVAVSLGSRLLMIRLGIFGYNSEISRLYETGRYSEYLNMGASLGPLALVVVSLNYFVKAPGHHLSRILMAALLVSEILFGVISGMKSLIVFPPLVVAACAYIAKNRISKLALLTVPVLLFGSYRLVEPFRDLRYLDPNFQNRSLTSIVETIQVSASEEGSRYIPTGSAPVTIQIAKRLNLTLMASLAIEFKDQGRLTDEDPEFLKYILSSPAFAVVPRFLWPSKPYEDSGSWFNSTVLDRPFINAVSMSPVGYLYLAGGGIAVVVVFLLIGIWQRVLTDWLLPKGSGGVLLFLSQLKLFIFMPTSVYPILIAAIRTLPLVGIVQLSIFKR